MQSFLVSGFGKQLRSKTFPGCRFYHLIMVISRVKLLDTSIPTAKHSSLWQRDIREFVSTSSFIDGWFRTDISWKLGEGSKINFWRSKWIGHRPLKETFPNLFNLSRDQRLVVCDAGNWSASGWIWDLGILSSNISIESRLQLEELYHLLSCVCRDTHVADSVVWWRDHVGFLVLGAYNSLAEFLAANFIVDENLSAALALSRSLPAPSNIKFFALRLILRRLPTRDALANRGILLRVHNLVCPLCLGQLNTLITSFSVIGCRSWLDCNI